MIEIKKTQGNIIYTKSTGTLTKNDYDKLLPVLNTLLEKHVKIRWYFEMENFTGWEPAALWEDLQFDIKHANDFEKIAMVGEREWQSMITQIMKPFSSAEIKYYDRQNQREAIRWIEL